MISSSVTVKRYPSQIESSRIAYVISLTVSLTLMIKASRREFQSGFLYLFEPRTPLSYGPASRAGIRKSF